MEGRICAARCTHTEGCLTLQDHAAADDLVAKYPHAKGPGYWTDKLEGWTQTVPEQPKIICSAEYTSTGQQWLLSSLKYKLPSGQERRKNVVRFAVDKATHRAVPLQANPSRAGSYRLSAAAQPSNVSIEGPAGGAVKGKKLQPALPDAAEARAHVTMLLAAIMANKDFEAAFRYLSTDEDKGPACVHHVLLYCVSHYLRMHPTSYLAVTTSKAGYPCAPHSLQNCCQDALNSSASI
jgi:hypothetical protein